ncbi:MAG TPA: hypothetical protein VG934_02835 [Candidatus Paceibacterota bacterium]|nr:hypothetical protein [Candidatus Paceibacterota bacterium]
MWLWLWVPIILALLGVGTLVALIQAKEASERDARRKLAQKEKSPAEKDQKKKADSPGIWQRLQGPAVFFLVLTTLWFVIWEWMPNAPIFTTIEGRFHIGFYYFLVVLLGLIDITQKDRRTRRTALIMMFAIFCIVGVRSSMLFHTSGVGAAGLQGFTAPVQPAVYSPGEEVISTGPRCDNVTRTVKFEAGFHPGHAGCNASWTISDESPTNCLIPIDGDGQPALGYADGEPIEVCKGGENALVGHSISGWRMTSETLLELRYHS